jgi:cytosine/adenosine deaminase-related metal-dependent hydrolase
LKERQETDLGACVVLPGLVNAHTHLELSSLRGRVPPARSMPVWVCDMLAARGFTPPPLDAIRAAIEEARACGTSLVGDISNSLATAGPLAEAGLAAAVFHEVLGFKAAGAAAIVERAGAAIAESPASDRVRLTMAVHAPYSSSRELFRAVHAWLGARAGLATTVHLGESPEEMQFLRDGTGPWRELLEEFRAWEPAWAPPGCGPVEYLAGLGALTERLLVAHGVQLDAGELARLAAAGATLVTCPRSNQWVGVGSPPVDRFYASGVRVAVGTDSLASAPDLNVFAELTELRRLAPSVPARRLLRSATHDGAAALGFGNELGAIAPGFAADLIAVDVPAGLEDVEEYLVSGICQTIVKWVP